MDEKNLCIKQNKTEKRIQTDIIKPSNRGKKTKLFFVSLVLFSLTFAAVCLSFIYLDRQGIIPDTLFAKILIGAGIFVGIELLLLFFSNKSIAVSVISIITCSVVLIASGLGIYTLQKVYEGMEKVKDPDTYYAHIGVYVRKDSRYAPQVTETEIWGKTKTKTVEGESLEGSTFGTMLLNLDRGYTSEGLRRLRKETNVSVNVYEDFGGLVDALRDGEIDALICNEALMALFLEDDVDFNEWATKVKEIGIETQNESIVVEADVVSEPFIVFIAGLDSYDQDEWRDDYRTDANILACVDPVEKKILLINTPRDYYVPLRGRNYAMDKLTHASVYGVEWSVETLEKLYDIEINYYVRTNIFSLIKIVDALGGITVHSDYQFYCANGIGGYHQFYVGDNEIDGAAALCFIREREQFENGDRQRGIHQEECIRAIVKKACSPAIVAHFSDVLKVVTESVRTNIGQREINAIVKMQLADMASWSFESYSVDGYGAFAPCYVWGEGELYVMKPDYDTVKEAREKLSEFMKK